MKTVAYRNQRIMWII